MMLIQTGSTIPEGQLCLTFDDGPGPHSTQISSYLCGERIVATFFVIGKFIRNREHIVQKLLDDGHEIGNHTYSHQKLTDTYAAAPEIASAHEELRPLFTGRVQHLFFRPPYGCWPTLPDLNENLTAQGERLGDLYSGPIPWDFDAADYRHWEEATGPDDALALKSAVARYSLARRGIVLMHDHSAEAHIANRNQTYRMIEQLVPIWRAQGLSFLSLREAHRRGWLDARM